ncbi:effector-associated constant component EACC1 [Actinomadura fibrosa]|uniref:Uncharacterized protein n=1 Tax=Actinomadura fibrosa TaxID=111802 RepID=A0ABW2XU32_9ACTN|nr:hypothetical protein [Actinomadura fibrosa]
MSDVILISTDGTAEELRSFREWLRDEPDVRRHAIVTLDASEPAEPGEMGGALDVVKLVIDTDFQLLNLGLAYLSWRSSRPRPAAVTIERDGVKITLDEADPEAVARLLRTLDG